MSLNPLQNPDFTSPLVEENRTATEPFQYWIDLVRASISAAESSASAASGSLVSLADGEEVSLDTGKAGYGECMIGDAQEHATFTFSSSGAIVLTLSTENVAKEDTASSLCIYWDASNSTVNIKNNLGSTLNLIYTVKYNDV